MTMPKGFPATKHPDLYSTKRAKTRDAAPKQSNKQKAQEIAESVNARAQERNDSTETNWGVDRIRAEKEDRAALQKSHDDLMRHMGVLLSQLAWGHHGITRMQALLASATLKKAADFAGTEPDPFYGPAPTHAWIEGLEKKLGG
jgi:hypothetical protein